jgi:hypothetical protein
MPHRASGNSSTNSPHSAAQSQNLVIPLLSPVSCSDKCAPRNDARLTGATFWGGNHARSNRSLTRHAPGLGRRDGRHRATRSRPDHRAHSGSRRDRQPGRRTGRHRHPRHPAQLDRHQAQYRDGGRRHRQRRDRQPARQLRGRHAGADHGRHRRPLQGQRQRALRARPGSDTELLHLQRPRGLDRRSRPLGGLPAVPVRAGQRRPGLQDPAGRHGRGRHRRRHQLALDPPAGSQAAHPGRVPRDVFAQGRRHPRP